MYIACISIQIPNERDDIQNVRTAHSKVKDGPYFHVTRQTTAPAYRKIRKWPGVTVNSRIRNILIYLVIITKENWANYLFMSTRLSMKYPGNKL